MWFILKQVQKKNSNLSNFSSSCGNIVFKRACEDDFSIYQHFLAMREINFILFNIAASNKNKTR